MTICMKPICIACGCDEDHGCPPTLCPIAGARGCFWLHFDARENVGLCSECGDFMQAWKQGRREPLVAMIAMRFYRQLLFLFPGSREQALAWLNEPHMLLGYARPSDCILEGRLDDVRALVDKMRSGAFA